MEIKDLSKYSNAEKILLAEQLWDSISKNEIALSYEVEQELDHRLKLLEEGKTVLYSLDEVKNHINKIRK
jgi:putative addiction module component (TIGR02574 family)